MDTSVAWSHMVTYGHFLLSVKPNASQNTYISTYNDIHTLPDPSTSFQYKILSLLVKGMIGRIGSILSLPPN